MKQHIKQLIENNTCESPMLERGIKGVQLFKVTQAIPCAPAVIAILNGSKEAILDGDHFFTALTNNCVAPCLCPSKQAHPERL